MRGNLVVQLRAQQPPRLRGPAPGDVCDLITSPTQDERRPTVAGNASDGRGVPRRRQIEFPKPVPCERVRPALQHDRSRVKLCNTAIHHGREDCLVTLGRDAVSQRSVEREPLAGANADVVQRARAREEAVAVLVERDREDAVGRQEGLLDAVAVVDVDVDVEDAVFLYFLFDEEEKTTMGVKKGRKIKKLERKKNSLLSSLPALTYRA